MPQNLPKWTEPQEYKQKDNGPPDHTCESICNPTNPGNAGKECGCYQKPNEVPVDGGLFFLFVAGLVFAISKLKQ